ncbi:MAG: AAA family ATPase [Pseudomonadota bacterium]
MAVIFLNGCTSAGKSSIAHALQQRAETPHLLTGIDDGFAMLAPRLHNHPDGFFFDRDARGAVRLNFGAAGRAALHAHQQAAAAIAASGVDLILDEVILSPDLLEAWRGCLAGVDTFWVGVHCDLEELERREIARGDRVPGQARGQFALVHEDLDYDFEVDTTHTPAGVCAAEILKAKAARSEAAGRAPA